MTQLGHPSPFFKTSSGNTRAAVLCSCRSVDTKLLCPCHLPDTTKQTSTSPCHPLDRSTEHLQHPPTGASTQQTPTPLVGSCNGRALRGQAETPGRGFGHLYVFFLARDTTHKLSKMFMTS